MSASGAIERQSISYRQGLVLGLTMAEIMLLLVFCLLLAAGATLRHERNAREAAERKSAAVKVATPAGEAIVEIAMRDAELADALKEGGPALEAKISDYWTKIVENRELARQLADNGITREEAKENVKFLSAAMELRRKGADAASLGEDAELAEVMRKFRKEDGFDAEEVKRIVAAHVENAKVVGAKDNPPDGHKWPPIISLSEAGGYFFKLGSAELSPEFEQQLTEVVVPILLQNAKKFDVDVIEVVGHTDELPIGARSSNLDRDLVEVMRGAKPIVALKPGDNAGLGLARSVSVVRNLLQDPRLQGMRVLPMSGAQLIKTNETLADGTEQGDVKERRRIEIRLRKSEQREDAR